MKSKNRKLTLTFVTALSSIILLGAGIAGIQVLAGMKTPPAKKPKTETLLRVEVMKAAMESVIPYIVGYGDVKAVNVVPISAEIQGRVTEIHPRLEIGEMISKDEILIKIDTKDEQLALQSNRKRYSALNRNLVLAKNEYQRLFKLNKKNTLVTISEVEKAEQEYQAAVDAFFQLEHSIADSRLQIGKGTIKAPFNGRIKTVSVEKGQYVTPGTTIVTLVNDSSLEIIASIDSEKAEKVLKFKENTKPTNQFWFSEVERVPVKVSWTQGQATSETWGILHRIVAFDSQNRTLKIAVRLANNNDNNPNRFPIVEGMFCRVQIPGEALQNIVKLPRHTVGYDDTVRVVSDNRLKTVPVDVSWMDEEFSYVSAGLNDADRVILTRLSNPLENTLVEFENDEMIATAGKRRLP